MRNCFFMAAVFLFLGSACFASAYFRIQGTITSFDSEFVVLSTSGGLIRLPRKLIAKDALRPGNDVSVLITQNVAVHALDGAATKRELNRK